MKMQAALWYGPEEIRIEEVEVPRIREGEVLVKIGTALTCGTDFKLFRQGHALLVKDVPSPFGHELAGTVVEAGPDVSPVAVGDRVVAANSAPCGDCFYCSEGRPNLCEKLEFLNGAYAEYIRIPSRIVQKNLYKIPEHVSFRDAALSEPLACVLHCVDRLSLQPGQTVCVIGAGTCGLLFTQLGKLHGVRMIVVGRGEEKLNVARRLGADLTVSILQDDWQQKVGAFQPSGRGPDIVIDATGQPDAWELATTLVRKGGSVWFYGGCAKGTRISLDTHRLHYDEITCAGVFHHTPAHFKRALELIANRNVSVDPLIQGEKRLRELNQVFLKGKVGNPLKIAIIP